MAKTQTMEELLALRSAQGKLLKLSRNQQVEGEIVAILGKEIILDLGTKAEGIIKRGDLANLKDLKIGDKLKSYVVTPENEDGQAVLSLQRQHGRLSGARAHRGGFSIDWDRFIKAQHQKSKLQGEVLQVNKGGLILEIEGASGFLPSSQIDLELLTEGLENLIGKNLQVVVWQVDPQNNKLIFSQRKQMSEEEFSQIAKKFTPDQVIKGKIINRTASGVVVKIDPSATSTTLSTGTLGTGSIEGFLPASKMDPNISYEHGKEMSFLLDKVDLEKRRINLVPFVTTTEGLIYK